MNHDERVALIAKHFPEYVGGTCPCGFEIETLDVWARPPGMDACHANDVKLRARGGLSLWWPSRLLACS
jgi:hypothetical protein